MSRIAASWILVLAAACGGSKSSSSTTTPTPKEVGDQIPKTAGPPCDEVATKLSIVVEAENPDNQAAAKASIAEHCSNDKWSDEARSCFATVENDDEVDGCRKNLTDAQRGKWSGGEPKASTESAPAGPADSAAKKKKPSGTRSADPEEGGE